MSTISARGGSQRPKQDIGQLVADAERLAIDRKFARAVDCMDIALRSQPDNLDWLRRRGRLLQGASRFMEAIKDFRKLVDLSPADAEGWLELGHCHRALDRLDDAEYAFLRALELAPRSVESMVSLGAMHRTAKSYESAIEWLEKAVSVNPAEVRAHCVLGTALLAAGQAEKGRASLEEAFSLNPYDRTTMAYLYVAFCQTGDKAAAIALTNTKHLVRSYLRCETCVDSSSVDPLNRKLAEHVRNHPSLEYERSGNTTRQGGHTGNLLEESSAPVSELFEWIDERIKQYLDDIPKDASHPYLAWSPKQWDIDAWGVVIQTGGYQEPHIHPDGWISGVYYVSVPEEIVSEDKNQQGCLELGNPPSPFGDRGEFPTRTLRPRPGRLNIFPSFLWHRTMPYESEEERICIAFDVRPRL